PGRSGPRDPRSARRPRARRVRARARRAPGTRRRSARRAPEGALVQRARPRAPRTSARRGARAMQFVTTYLPPLRSEGAREGPAAPRGGPGGLRRDAGLLHVAARHDERPELVRHEAHQTIFDLVPAQVADRRQIELVADRLREQLGRVADLRELDAGVLRERA